MTLTDEFKAELKQYNLNFKEAEHVEQAIAEADVILVEPVVQPDYTKSRQEAGDHGMTPANYKITRELLGSKAKSDAILLHSLPRMDEIPPDVDITRWSRYWQEAFNGVVMRMALLALVLGATSKIVKKPTLRRLTKLSQGDEKKELSCKLSYTVVMSSAIWI